EQVGGPRNRSHTRVNYNELCALVPRLPDVVSQNRKTFANITASDQDTIRQGNVAPGVGGTVDTKGHFIGRASRNHTQPPVIVDVGRAQGHTSELAHQVGFLVSQ